MAGTRELESLIKRLIKEGKFPHAILFEGEKGTGKEKIALWCSKALLCCSEDAPCEVCSVCRKIDSQNHSDITFIVPEEKKNFIGIETIKRMKDTLYLSPNEGKCKVYIIPDAEAMTRESQNALLKSLEEPPENVYFILTTDNQSFLLDTIISRTMVFRISGIGKDACSESLMEEFKELPEDDIYFTVLACGGSYELAHDELTKGMNIKTALAADTIPLAKSGKNYTLLKRLETEIKDRNELGQYLEKLGNIVGYSVVDRYGGKKAKLIIRPKEAVTLLDIIEKCKTSVEMNGSKTVISGWFVTQICTLFGGNNERKN